MGNPSVRFDEGRERAGHWPVGLSTHPLPPTLLSLAVLDLDLAGEDGVMLCKQRNKGSSIKNKRVNVNKE